TGVLDCPFSLIKDHSPPITLFLLTHKAQKKKLCKKKSAVWEFRPLRRATAVSPAARDKLFKKSLSKNFARTHKFYPSFPFIQVLWLNLSSKKG
ncbi:MAG: hypothetical protein II292_04850, partial [Clostridia bacterium]|nr:hypothetical protein [Clostridia bacterium]